VLGMLAAGDSLLPEVTAAVRPPRVLSVPFALGYPLGIPGDAAGQSSILRELLRVALHDDVPFLARLPDTSAEPRLDAA
jgi:hypothetical protein